MNSSDKAIAKKISEGIQEDAVQRIRDRVVPEQQEAALLSHREVVACLAGLKDRKNLNSERALQQAAALLGLDRDVLSSVLIEGLSALEYPRDSFHFEVLVERATYAPAKKTKKGGR